MSRSDRKAKYPTYTKKNYFKLSEINHYWKGVNINRSREGALFP